MSTISVVIPTYNRRDLIERCLDSLALQTHDDIEIIVVDDGSTDATTELVASRYPRARVERLPRNSGFAAAANAGLRAARGAWVLLLNNDVTMEPDCIARMLETAKRTGADIVAPLILWDDDRARIYSAGDRMRKDGRPEPIGFRQPRADFAPPEFIFGATAACGLFRRDIFDTVGLLDESFGAYFEDSDLCFRARLAGFRAALAIGAVAYHIGSASQSGRTWWRSAQCYRNHALLVEKSMPDVLREKQRALIAAERRHQRMRLWTSARAELGTLRAVGVALRYALSLQRALPAARRARTTIQAAARVTPHELDTWLSNPE
jgi:GT2 family glycosyltransferase